MSNEFKFSMERLHGGPPVTISVTDAAVSVYLAPVSVNEQRTLDGLVTLGQALRKETVIPEGLPQPGEPTLQFMTPEGRNASLGMITAEVLERQGVTKPGSSKAYTAAADKFEHPSLQEVQTPVPQISNIEQLNNIRNAMIGMVEQASDQAPSRVAQVAELAAVKPGGHFHG